MSQSYQKYFKLTIEKLVAASKILGRSLSAKALLYLYFKIRLADNPKWEIKVTPKQLQKELKIPKSTFYRAMSDLASAGLIVWSTSEDTEFKVSLGTENDQQYKDWDEEDDSAEYLIEPEIIETITSIPPEPMTQPAQQQRPLAPGQILAQKKRDIEGNNRPIVSRTNFLYPVGPWLNEKGQIDPDFMTWTLKEWERKFEKKSSLGDVMIHYKNHPENIPIRWDEYQSLIKKKEETEQAITTATTPIQHKVWIKTPEELAEEKRRAEERLAEGRRIFEEVQARRRQLKAIAPPPPVKPKSRKHQMLDRLKVAIATLTPSPPIITPEGFFVDEEGFF